MQRKGERLATVNLTIFLLHSNLVCNQVRPERDLNPDFHNTNTVLLALLSLLLKKLSTKLLRNK